MVKLSASIIMPTEHGVPGASRLQGEATTAHAMTAGRVLSWPSLTERNVR